MTGSAKGKITKFKEDKRLIWTGALRALALVGMLGTLVFCIWNYQDDLNVKNFRRIVSYLSLIGTERGEFTEYRFESGLSTEYAPFGSGLAVCSGDTYRFVTAIDKDGFSLQLKYVDPVIETSRRTALIYDRGGKGLCVVNSYSELFQTQLSSDIISASMNQSGAFTVVTNESEYRAAVTMYDEKQRELYKWQTSNYYLMLSAPAPKGDRFAVLCLGEKDGGFRSLVRIYRVTEQEPEKEIDLGNRTVYSLRYNNQGNLVIICADGVYIYDKQGEQVGLSEYEEGALSYFSHCGEDNPLLAIQSGSGEFEVRALGDKGETVYSQRVSGSLRSMDYRSGRGALLFSNSMIVIDLTDKTPEVKTFSNVIARNVQVREDGKIIVVYPDRAQVWNEE